MDQRPKILIVEDHTDSRHALSALLQAHGYSVIEAANGRDAIERAIAEKPSLILMDIMMPEVDGFDATRAIRRHSQLRHVPIIAMTAMEGAKELAFQAGMSDYVLKPVDISRLLKLVSGWLEPAPA